MSAASGSMSLQNAKTCNFTTKGETKQEFTPSSTKDLVDLIAFCLIRRFCCWELAMGCESLRRVRAASTVTSPQTLTLFPFLSQIPLGTVQKKAVICFGNRVPVPSLCCFSMMKLCNIVPTPVPVPPPPPKKKKKKN